MNKSAWNLTQADALRVCRKQFAFYAEQHRAKNTPEAEHKALVNDRMVVLIDDVLDETSDHRSEGLSVIVNDTSCEPMSQLQQAVNAVTAK